MKKILLSLVATAALLLGVGASTASAQAAAPGDLEIVQVGTDAMGGDTLANRYREFIDIKNTGATEVNVKGWETQDSWAANHPDSTCNTIKFRKATSVSDAGGFQHLSTHDDGLWLPAGHTIRVYTGGSADGTDNTWHTVAINKSGCGLNGHYLNNDTDSVRVVDAEGTQIDKVWWNHQGGYESQFS